MKKSEGVAMMYDYICDCCGTSVGIDENIPDEELKYWACIYVSCSGSLIKDLKGEG